MGFDLLEYVKKSNYENTALIAPAGYGKTQFLLKCFEALKNENGVVPCYIDAAALNTKDLYTELQKYFFKDEKSYLGSIEFFKRFYNMVSAQSEIKYVLLINHYEDAFNNESIADVTNIIENFVKMGCCVIVSSAFNDGKVFENFKVLKLEPHSKEKIISILEDKFKDLPKFDFKNLKEQVYSIISTPLMLGWYIELIKTNSANDVMINSEHQLIDRRFNEVIDNDFVLKTAYYCAEHKTKYIAEKELVELLLAHNGKVRLISRIFGKKHINDFEADVLMLEKYGIAKYEKNNQKLVFSNQIYVDYFAAKKIGRDVNNNNFDVFDELIFSEQICKFLSYEIDKSSLLTELDSLRANQGGNVNRCFESCDDIVKTTNLVNTLYFYKNSFKDCDLHSLDLRLCNFIGKKCVDTDFSNSLCNDACFVPLESETPDFFAISENGKYFATGNKSAVNIWDAKYSNVIHRVLSDESSPFTDIGYKKDTGFVISANSELYSSVIVKIKNGIISQSLNYDKNIVSSCIEKSKKDSVDKFDSYGTLCCKQENFVLLRSDENSYYGNAYLLFDIENEKLLSVCKVNTHLKISDAVQDGDEIEFLIKNDGKPLRSICFNDSTKEIYRKNYPSLVGKTYKVENYLSCFDNIITINQFCSTLKKQELCVYFDNNNFDSFLKWYFYDEKFLNKENCTENIISKLFYLPFDDRNIIKNKKCIFELIGFKNINDQKSINCELVFNNHNFSAFSSQNDFSDFNEVEIIPNTYNIDLRSVFDAEFIEETNDLFDCLLPFMHTDKGMNVIDYDDEYCCAISNFIFNISIENEHIILSKKSYYPLKFYSNFNETINNMNWKSIMKSFEKEKIESDNLNEKYILSNIIREKSNNIIIGKVTKTDAYLYRHCFVEILYTWYLGIDKPINWKLYDNDYFIRFIRNFCYPCDDGVVYFNGKYMCYKKYNGTDIEFLRGNIGFHEYRCGMHYTLVNVDKHCKYDCYYYMKLYDIFKSNKQNETEKPIIPIYDLNLYKSNITDVLGISAGVKDILEKQTQIYTKYLTFDD